jgi:hypothetical protein
MVLAVDVYLAFHLSGQYILFERLSAWIRLSKLSIRKYLKLWIFHYADDLSYTSVSRVQAQGLDC